MSRGHQNYAYEILTGASGLELQSVERMKICYHAVYKLLRDNRQFGTDSQKFSFL